MKKILLFAIFMLSFVMFTSCTKSIDKYAEETLDETFNEYTKKHDGFNKYELSDKEIVYKSDSLCIIEFKCSESYNGTLITGSFEYIISRGYKSPYRIKEGKFEKRVIHEIVNKKSCMNVYDEQCKFLHDDYEADRIERNISKEDYYQHILYTLAHSIDGDYTIETKIE